MPLASLKHIDLFYEQQGHGPHLLLIGGLTTNHSIWRPMINTLAQSFTVTSFDNRGAGQSTQPAALYSAEEMAQDTATLMEHLRIDHAFVVGHSMGGLILQALAVTFPEKVTAGIIASSSMKFPLTTQLHIKTSIKLMASDIEPLLMLELIFPWIYGNEYLSCQKNIDNEIHRIIEDPHPQSLAGYTGQVHAITSFDYREKSKTIACPMLALSGDNDLLVPYTHQQAFSETLPHCYTRTLAHCGHMPHREVPQTFCEEIVDFSIQFNKTIGALCVTYA